MHDINQEMERRIECWNTRFSQCLKERGFTQTGFADVMNKVYNTKAFTQKAVNRWMHIGEPRKGLKNLPEYETMLKIANVLNVEVGYLTGETDGTSYDIQRAADFLNLTVKTINAIRNATVDRGSRFFHRPIPLQSSFMYEKLLTSDGFLPFLAQMEELDLEYNRPQKKKEYLEHLADGDDRQIYEKISPYIGYPFSPDEDPGFSDEEIEAFHKLNDAVDDANTEEENREIVLDFLRYRLLKEYEKLISLMYP